MEKYKLGRRTGCLTAVGVSAWDLVVGFAGIQTGPDDRFEFEHPGANRSRDPASKLVPGGGKLVEGGEGVSNHGLEVERAGGLIESPERFGAVGVELKELLGLRLREGRWEDRDVIESAQKRKRIQPGHLEPGAQVLRNKR